MPGGGRSRQASIMRRNIIPFERAKRSVKEVVEKFYQDLDDIEEIVIIAKDREGEWIFANSELENELEWIGSLYKFINKAIMEDGEDF
jgi:RNase P protein component